MFTATTATREPLGTLPPDTPTSYRAVLRRVIIALWIAAALYVLVLSSLVARAAAGRLRVSEPILEPILFLVLWAVATPAIIWSAGWLPVDRRRWRSRVAVHAAIAVCFIFALNIVAPTLTWMILGRPSRYESVWRHGLAMFVAVGHLAL